MPHLRLAVLISFLSVGVNAQWLNFPTPGTPRTADGKPNLTAPAPRALDGTPDLSGVWMHEITTVAEVRRLFGTAFEDAIKVDVPGMEIGTQHKYAFDILLDQKPEESIMRPEAMEILRQHRRASAFEDPASVCTGVIGFPLAGLLSEPIKIVQAPRLTMILYEVHNLRRQIYTDGRIFPRNSTSRPTWATRPDIGSATLWSSKPLASTTKPRWMQLAHPHSEALRVTERFRRRDFGHLDVEMTFDDPQMYTKPFYIKIPHNLLADADIFEDFCDNEKDRVHLGSQPKPSVTRVPQESGFRNSLVNPKAEASVRYRFPAWQQARTGRNEDLGGVRISHPPPGPGIRTASRPNSDRPNGFPW